MNIAFFVRQFSERGTEVAIYDYARYNEEILLNKSFIICFNTRAQRRNGFSSVRASYLKFHNRFQIIEIDNMADMSSVVEQYKLQFFYTQVYGSKDTSYHFDNKTIWGNCQTIKHCVFDTTFKEGDFYISISNTLNLKNKTELDVIPYIVSVETCDVNLREELNIPKDAFVFGRHGGYKEFNIGFVHESIIAYLSLKENTYFIFLNTEPFFTHPRIIYLKKNVNTSFKRQFINTCDAMIHAREEGETFGLAIAEFSCCNKPVLTCSWSCGDQEHIQILGDKCIKYNSKEELDKILIDIKTIVGTRENWNAYQVYSPQNVMTMFNDTIFKAREKKKQEKDEEEKEIIFVTAFKDIGRSCWSTLHPRTNEEYFEYFSNLTQNIDSILIVYLENDIKDELLTRYKFKKNIIFLNMSLVDDTFYNRFLSQDETIMNNTIYQNKIPSHRKYLPEHLYSKYNLINHSKIDFVKNAKSLFPDYEYYSWIDFGFIRQREATIRSINVKELPRKIIYHCLQIPNLNEKISANDMLKSDAIFLTGSAFIVHKDLVETFHKMYENKLLEWHEMVVTDDDQSLILQLYYDHPDLFYLKQSDEWFSLYELLLHQ